MDLLWLQKAIFKRRLISWATLELLYTPQWMYHNYFMVGSAE